MSNSPLHKRMSKTTGNTYYSYVPPSVSESTPLFVTVHGWSRNAEEHARRFLPLAEQYGVVMIAPLFDSADSPRYQRLGKGPTNLRADHILDAIIKEVTGSIGIEALPFALFGFSGGGQFGHRYMMAHPDRVSRLALGAPGWYTFPDPAQRFPRGTGEAIRLAGVKMESWRCLRVPVRVFVGEKDTRQSHHLNTAHSINRLQGINRLERAQRWVKAMTAAARACRYSTSYSLELLPDSNHSFGRCMEKGGMGEKVFKFLFDSSREEVGSRYLISGDSQSAESTGE